MSLTSSLSTQLDHKAAHCHFKKNSLSCNVISHYVKHGKGQSGLLCSTKCGKGLMKK